MATFYIVKSEADLEHHGIKGQKWGVRNGPPYPMKASQKSTADKKESTSGLKQKGGVEMLLAVPVIAVTSAAIRRGRMAVEKAIYRHDVDYRYQLDDSWASEKVLKQYQEDRARDKESAKKVTGEADLKKKETMGTPEDDMLEVNPKRNTFGYTMNCMYCSASFELRRRGYDVRARERVLGGNDREIQDWYKDPKSEAYRTAKEAINAMKRQPNGARGMLSGVGPWGGHELNYEINNGKLTIYDPQNNTTRSEGWYKKFYAQGVVTRLDNLEIKWDGIGEVISDDSVRKRGD